MSIVTKTGDHGETSLMYGRRVQKNDPRVAAYGAVDELTAALYQLPGETQAEPWRLEPAQVPAAQLGEKSW